MKRVLGVEDRDEKWERICATVRNHLPESEIVRETDLYRGEQRLIDEKWDLVLLDISLDIRQGASRGGRGGHDFVAGLKLASVMYYLKIEIPTIIITGFDAFPSGRSSHDKDVILGLQDVKREAKKLLGDFLVGTVRFGPAGWEDELATMLSGLPK